MLRWGAFNWCTGIGGSVSEYNAWTPITAPDIFIAPFTSFSKNSETYYVISRSAYSRAGCGSA